MNELQELVMAFGSVCLIFGGGTYAGFFTKDTFAIAMVITISIFIYFMVKIVTKKETPTATDKIKNSL